MPTLFVATLGAYAKVSIDADGERYITLGFKHGDQQQGTAAGQDHRQAIRAPTADAARRAHGPHATHHTAACGTGRVRIEGRKFKMKIPGVYTPGI